MLQVSVLVRNPLLCRHWGFRPPITRLAVPLYYTQTLASTPTLSLDRLSSQSDFLVLPVIPLAILLFLAQNYMCVRIAYLWPCSPTDETYKARNPSMLKHTSNICFRIHPTTDTGLRLVRVMQLGIRELSLFYQGSSS